VASELANPVMFLSGAETRAFELTCLESWFLRCRRAPKGPPGNVGGNEIAESLALRAGREAPEQPVHFAVRACGEIDRIAVASIAPVADTKAP